MSALDVIALPGQPGKYARRAIVEAWQEAGSPPVNSAGRLYADQKHFYDGWRAGLPGFNPADNPDDETQRLAHVRFVALDIDPTPARVQRLSAAGLIRPYTYEPWHWELPNVRTYGIVRKLPAPASGGGNTTRPEEDEDMIIIIERSNSKLSKARLLSNGKARIISPAENNVYRDLPASFRQYVEVSNADFTALTE